MRLTTGLLIDFIISPAIGEAVLSRIKYGLDTHLPFFAVMEDIKNFCHQNSIGWFYHYDFQTKVYLTNMKFKPAWVDIVNPLEPSALPALMVGEEGPSGADVIAVAKVMHAGWPFSVLYGPANHYHQSPQNNHLA